MATSRGRPINGNSLPSWMGSRSAPAATRRLCSSGRATTGSSCTTTRLKSAKLRLLPNNPSPVPSGRLESVEGVPNPHARADQKNKARRPDQQGNRPAQPLNPRDEGALLLRHAFFRSEDYLICFWVRKRATVNQQTNQSCGNDSPDNHQTFEQRRYFHGFLPARATLKIAPGLQARCGPCSAADYSTGGRRSSRFVASRGSGCLRVAEVDRRRRMLRESCR